MNTLSFVRSKVQCAVPLTAILLNLVAGSAQAAHFTTTTQQAAGADWTAAIWNPGPVSPTAGNTYEVLAGGRVRPPDGTTATGGTGTTNQSFTFPGDSLMLTGVGFNNTNGSGELRLKQDFNGPIFNFPGVGANPGLILNGGIINNGDDRVMTIAGRISAVAGATSSINPGGSAVTDISAARAFTFDATLSGSGNLTLDYAHDIGAAVPALLLNGTGNSFTGAWTLNSGWLRAAGLNSMGFGDISLTSTQGPSTLDFDYNLSNPSGALTLTGPTSKLQLDQNLTFRSVTINGTALAPGVHSFSQLNTSFDANFIDGGTGSITVVPEPGSLVLLLGGAGLLIRRRR